MEGSSMQERMNSPHAFDHWIAPQNHTMFLLQDFSKILLWNSAIKSSYVFMRRFMGRVWLTNLIFLIRISIIDISVECGLESQAQIALWIALKITLWIALRFYGWIFQKSCNKIVLQNPTVDLQEDLSHDWAKFDSLGMFQSLTTKHANEDFVPRKHAWINASIVWRLLETVRVQLATRRMSALWH